MEQQEVITVRTKMDGDDYRRFLMDSVFKINLAPTLVSQLFLAVCCTALSVTLTGIRHTAAVIGFTIFFLAVFLTVKWFRLIFQSVIHEKHDVFRRFGIFRIFKFEELGIRCMGDSGEEANYIPYAQIYRMAENRDYFYVYLTCDIALVMRKRDMDTADAVQLGEMMKEKISLYYSW